MNDHADRAGLRRHWYHYLGIATTPTTASEQVDGDHMAPFLAGDAAMNAVLPFG